MLPEGFQTRIAKTFPFQGTDIKGPGQKASVLFCGEAGLQLEPLRSRSSLRHIGDGRIACQIRGNIPGQAMDTATTTRVQVQQMLEAMFKQGYLFVGRVSS